MNEKELLEYNKRCAEFLDIVTEEPHWVEFNKFMPNSIAMSYGRRHHIEQLQFHSDWNWIMEMVEAIENKLNDSFNVDIVNKNQCEIVRNGEEFICGAGFDTTNHHKKEAVVEAINQFLIWYEQNK